MKIKVKTLYNIGDEVIVPDRYKPGYVILTKIRSIEVKVDKNNEIDVVYYVDSCSEYYRENHIQTKEEFDEEQRVKRRGYKDYLKWLGKQEFIGE